VDKESSAILQRGQRESAGAMGKTILSLGFGREDVPGYFPKEEFKPGI
jgi:hypothetical protein